MFQSIDDSCSYIMSVEIRILRVGNLGVRSDYYYVEVAAYILLVRRTQQANPKWLKTAPDPPRTILTERLQRF